MGQITAARTFDHLANGIGRKCAPGTAFDSFDALVDRDCAQPFSRSGSEGMREGCESCELNASRTEQGGRTVSNECAAGAAHPPPSLLARAITHRGRACRELSPRRRRARLGRQVAPSRCSITKRDGYRRNHNLNFFIPPDISLEAAADRMGRSGMGVASAPSDRAASAFAIHRSDEWLSSNRSDLCASVASAMLGLKRREPVRREGI